MKENFINIRKRKRALPDRSKKQIEAEAVSVTINIIKCLVTEFDFPEHVYDKLCDIIALQSEKSRRVDFGLDASKLAALCAVTSVSSFPSQIYSLGLASGATKESQNGRDNLSPKFLFCNCMLCFIAPSLIRMIGCCFLPVCYQKKRCLPESDNHYFSFIYSSDEEQRELNSSSNWSERTIGTQWLNNIFLFSARDAKKHPIIVL